jgi:hypothetical protein
VNGDKKHVNYELKNSVQQRKEHKIVIIGDSHARGCANNVKINLNRNYKACGFVKPGTNINSLTCSVMSDSEHLTNKDIIVFWGGTNDVSKNNSQVGLKHIVNFVKLNSHTNIILMSVPRRHDLPDWSCMNSEVKTFNRKLVKFMKPFKYVTIAKVNLNRECFTRHGLHMNNLGKDRIALMIANSITTVLKKTNRRINQSALEN